MRQERHLLITTLIDAYARDSGTESLIGAVADNRGMLDACRELFDINGRIDPHQRDWFNDACSRAHVNPAECADAVYQVLFLFNNHHDQGDHYATLGLQAGASEAEIKAAYRKLSLRYHPDRAAQNDSYEPQRFIEISQAYHHLTNPAQSAPLKSGAGQSANWKRGRKRGISNRKKRKLAYWGAGALVLLIVISIVGSLSVRKRAMLAGLTEDRGAFIPPEQGILEGPVDIKSSSDNPLPLEPSIEAEQATVPTQSEIITDPPPTTQKPAPALQQPEPALAQETPLTDEPIRLSPEKWKTTRVSMAAADAGSEPVQIVRQSDNEDTVDTVANDDSLEETIPAVTTDPPVRPDKKQEEIQAVPDQAPDHKRLPPHPAETESVVAERQAPSTTGTDEATEITESKPKAVIQSDENQPVKPDIHTKVATFLINYTDCYTQLDFDRFTTFFTPDAQENKKPFSKRKKVYKKLFASLKKSELRIDLLKSTQTNKRIKAEGRFRVTLDYKSGKHSSGSGLISFVLTDEAGTLQIMTMDYHFD